MNQSEAIIFGDLHIENNEIIDRPIIDFIRKTIQSHQIVIITGDIFDSFDVGAKDNLFYKFISELKNQVYLLCGNHDFSRNRNALKVVNYFSSNIHIIPGYQTVDIQETNYRFHFYNYFKDIKKEFDFDDNKTNVLFSHCDLRPKFPYKEFTKFDLVVNGHLHDFEMNDKYINLGAVRLKAISENPNKKYMTINLEDKKLNYKLHDFKSVIDIKKCFVNELDSIKIERNSIIKIMLTPLQDVADMIKKTKTLDWYDESKVVLRTEQYIDKEVIDTIISDVSDASNLDIIKLFDEYLATYIAKFKIKDIEIDKIKQLFFEIYNREFQEMKNLFSIYDIKFKKISATNFKLFEKMELNFDKYSGIIAISGQNHEEPDKSGDPSSNESGKSCIRNLIEYCILGSKSEIDPLSWGKKSGLASINLTINGDNVVINRKFSSKSSSVDIKIDNMDFMPDETNTDKLEGFFIKYNFQNAIQFILVSNTGLARYFFSSKNSEKFKIFKDIFPIIQHISEFVLKIKERVKTIENEYNSLENEKQGIIDKRKDNARFLFDKLQDIRNKENELDIVNININIDKYRKLINPDILNKETEIKQTRNILLNSSNIDIAYNIFNQNLNIRKTSEDYEKENEKISKLNILSEKQNIIEDDIREFNKKIKDNENTLFECGIELNKLSKIDKDLNNIKTLLQRLTAIKFIKEKYNIININNLFNDENKVLYVKLNNKKETITNDLNTYKEEYLKIQKEIKNLEDGIKISMCNVCGSKLDNSKKIITHVNELNESLTSVKSSGTLKKEELEVTGNEIEELRKKITKNEEIVNDIENNLKPVMKNKDMMIEYINNYDSYIIEVDGFELDTIDSIIQEQENIKTLEENIKTLNERIEDIKDSLDHKILDLKIINKDKSEINVDNKIIEKYNEIINIFEDKDLDKNDYLIFESRIKQILELGIIKNIDQKYIQNIEKIYMELEKNLEMKLSLNDLEIKLKYENEKKESIKKDFKNLSDSVKKIRKELSLKEINKKLFTKLKTYDTINTLYTIMTKKRKINFERYFINHFFSKVQSIFNAFMSILFTRGISLNIDADNFNFIDKKNNTIAFKSFSNGAKTKIESSLIFTIGTLFTNYGVRSNILIFDEFLDSGVDAVNLERLFTVIKMFFSRKKVFVMSHKEISEYINSEIIVKRDNGGSILFN